MLCVLSLGVAFYVYELFMCCCVCFAYIRCYRMLWLSVRVGVLFLRCSVNVFPTEVCVHVFVVCIVVLSRAHVSPVCAWFMCLMSVFRCCCCYCVVVCDVDVGRCVLHARICVCIMCV